MADAGQSVWFKTHDRVVLNGTLFTPAAVTGLPVLICPGTGISQHVYFAFAQWLATHGHAVLVFDYRGIGKSRGVSHARESVAFIHEWGQLDMPAALDFLLDTTGAPKACLIGHSAGGVLPGLMHNHARIDQIIAVAASIGYIGDMPLLYRPFAHLFIKYYLPLCARILGYVPLGVIGWGEDLPAGVGLQWSRWCGARGYVANDFGVRINAHFYDAMDMPVTFIGITDDPISTLRNIEGLQSLFGSKPHHQRVMIDPVQYGLKKIGHATMFRSALSVLWPVIAQSLLQRTGDVGN